MQMILLDETRFNDYAETHPQKNYYQTTNYGKMMSKLGNNAYYLGLTDDQNNIKAATLIVVKNNNSDKRKIAYAPRGFLIDWNDSALVTEFTKELKEFLAKRNFTHIKVDPYIIYKEHSSTDINSTYLDYGTAFVSNMQSLGYIHLGYNNSAETNCYRWNCITELEEDVAKVYRKLSLTARKKIKEAASKGLRVYKGTSVDISLLSTISNNKVSNELLLDYYQFYGEKFEIYFIKFEPYNFVNASKELFEKEEANNTRLNDVIQNPQILDKTEYINMKMESDRLVAKYKKEMQDASIMFQSYPNGIIIAGIALIKNNNSATIIAEYEDEKFKNQYPGYILKWQLMQEYGKKGMKIFDFGGILMDYKSNYTMNENVELSTKIVEYYGEFDLVINKKSYYTGSRLNPILNWLNTPI